MRIVWAPRAQRQLQAIIRFIPTDQPAAAERVLEQVLGRRGQSASTHTSVDGDFYGVLAS